MNDRPKLKQRDADYILKMGFVVIGVLMVLAIIVASWIWNLIFDPEHFDFVKWATRAIFNGSISLAMMVASAVVIWAFDEFAQAVVQLIFRLG